MGVERHLMDYGNPTIPIPTLVFVPGCPGGWRWVTAMRREIREANPRKKRLTILLVRVPLYSTTLAIQILTPPSLQPQPFHFILNKQKEPSYLILASAGIKPQADLPYAGGRKIQQNGYS